MVIVDIVKDLKKNYINLYFTVSYPCECKCMQANRKSAEAKKGNREKCQATNTIHIRRAKGERRRPTHLVRRHTKRKQM